MNIMVNPSPTIRLITGLMDADTNADIGLAVRAFFEEVSTLSADDAAHLRQEFRNVMAESWLLAHAIRKPFGYPGDFQILEAIYNGYTPSVGQGRLIDDWCLSTALPRAVDQRKDIIRELLRKTPDGIKALSLASGSARELRDLGDLGERKFTLVDTDAAPLEFFRKNAPTGDVTTIVANALKSDVGVGQFDLVYSFGLYDYLPDSLLDRAIKNAKRHLKPDGQFVFALKDSRFYNPELYDWFCDWRFVPRTINSLWPLLDRHDLDLVSVETTDNEAVFVVTTCTK